MVEKACGGSALTVSVQDGAAAGQSVPHVHVHILPRREGDITPNDLVSMGSMSESWSGLALTQPALQIYTHLERFGLSLAKTQEAVAGTAASGANGVGANESDRSGLKVDADEDRKPRTMEQMEAEAQWLSKFFDK